MRDQGSAGGKKRKASIDRSIRGFFDQCISPPILHSHSLSPLPQNRYPYVTGTSVLGLVFEGGVMLASDTLGEWREERERKKREKKSRCSFPISSFDLDLRDIL